MDTVELVAGWCQSVWEVVGRSRGVRDGIGGEWITTQWEGKNGIEDVAEVNERGWSGCHESGVVDEPYGVWEAGNWRL